MDKPYKRLAIIMAANAVALALWELYWVGLPNPMPPELKAKGYADPRYHEMDWVGFGVALQGFTIVLIVQAIVYGYRLKWKREAITMWLLSLALFVLGFGTCANHFQLYSKRHWREPQARETALLDSIGGNSCGQARRELSTGCFRSGQWPCEYNLTIDCRQGLISTFDAPSLRQEAKELACKLNAFVQSEVARIDSISVTYLTSNGDVVFKSGSQILDCRDIQQSTTR